MNGYGFGGWGGWGRRGQGRHQGRGQGGCALPAAQAPEVKPNRAIGGSLPMKTAAIDDERCIRCGICMNICPDGAIQMADSFVVDPTRCSGCGLCTTECPNQAIELRDRGSVAASGKKG